MLRGLVIVGLLFAGCNKEEKPADPIPQPEGSTAYSGPGSVFSLDLGTDGKFKLLLSEAAGAPTDMSLGGTYERYRGFVIMKIDVSEGASAPPVGAEIVGLEVPGFLTALMTQFDGHPAMIPMLASGTCPTEDLTMNWLKVQGLGTRDASSSTEAWFGTYTYSFATSTMAVPTEYALAGYAAIPPNGQTLSPSACNPQTAMTSITKTKDGAQSHIADLWRAKSAAMARSYESDGSSTTILGTTVQSLSSEALAGTYSSVMLIAGKSKDETGLPMQFTLDKTGAATGALLNGVQEGVLDSAQHTMTLTAFDQPSKGWIQGSYTGFGGTVPMACMANSSALTENYGLIFCTLQDPADTKKAAALIMRSIAKLN